jgi:hypothetical protein
MTRQIIIICASIFMLVLGVTCESTTRDVGPYTVSFDAGRDVELSVQDPMELRFGVYNLTQYSLDGYIDAPKGENHFVITMGTSDPAPDPAEFEVSRTIENKTAGIRNSMVLIGATPFSISSRTFDGYDGMIGVAYWDLLRETLIGGQWLTNNTIVSITSNIPWGEGTQQIFDTIHIVEKEK